MSLSCVVVVVVVVVSDRLFRLIGWLGRGFGLLGVGILCDGCSGQIRCVVIAKS